MPSVSKAIVVYRCALHMFFKLLDWQISYEYMLIVLLSADRRRYATYKQSIVCS